jgi:hypothetical protein
MTDPVNYNQTYRSNGNGYIGAYSQQLSAPGYSTNLKGNGSASANSSSMVLDQQLFLSTYGTGGPNGANLDGASQATASYVTSPYFPNLPLRGQTPGYLAFGTRVTVDGYLQPGASATFSVESGVSLLPSLGFSLYRYSSGFITIDRPGAFQ